MERYSSFFKLPYCFYKDWFYFRQPFLCYVCLSLHCVSPVFQQPLSCGSLLLISASGAGSAHWQVVTDLTQWKDRRWTRLVKIAPMKANRDINEPTPVLLWSPMRPGAPRQQNVCRAVSCQTKWHESWTSEDHRDGEFKEKAEWRSISASILGASTFTPSSLISRSCL